MDKQNDTTTHTSSEETSETEREWLKTRIEWLFESDPGPPVTFLRKVINAVRLDLELLAIVADDAAALESFELTRQFIVLNSRLQAALDIDEYFQRGHMRLTPGEEWDQQKRDGKVSQ
jgi:hypothetical protein